MGYFGLISDCYMDYSMHVFDTMYRKEFRKVILSKLTSTRKKHEKGAKYVQFLAVLTRDFSIDINVYIYIMKVQWGSLYCYCTGFCSEVLILF